MRAILIVVLVIAASLIGGIAFILFNLDAILKETVEKVGSEMTQTSVTLQGANVDPANGMASMSGLDIANPAGFKSDHAVALGLISVKMDPTTVTGDVVVINEIVVDSPSIIYEIGQDGGNIDKLHENIMAFANQFKSATEDGSSSDSSASQGSTSEEASSGPKMIIENVYVRNVMTAVHLSVLGDQTLEVPAVNVHLTDIGKKEGGVLATEAAIQIMDNLFKDVIANAANSSSGKLLKEALGDVNVDDVKQQLEDKANEALGGGSVEDITKDAEGALKNLFGTGN